MYPNRIGLEQILLNFRLFSNIIIDENMMEIILTIMANINGALCFAIETMPAIIYEFY